MKVVSIINYKGGVGKTTLTANIGAQLAWTGKKVLLIDLDPQASLTFSFMKPDDWKNNFSKDKTIKTWFDSFSDLNFRELYLKSLVVHPEVITEALQSGKGCLDLICSHLGLLNVDLELASELGGASLKQAKRNFFKVHKRLADGIDNDLRNEYDVLLIDCPPNFNIVTKTAIVSSDYIFIPAKPDYLSTLGIDYLIRSLKSLVGDFNEYKEQDDDGTIRSINPEILGVVFTMVQYYAKSPIKGIRQYMSAVGRITNTITNKPLRIFKNHVRENKTIFSEAPQNELPVVISQYANSTHENVVSEIERLTDEFKEVVGM